MENRIKDLEQEIKDLKERIKFKDLLLDQYFEMFGEIVKHSDKISNLIKKEFKELEN